MTSSPRQSSRAAPERVVVAMSGGVDSSVAAALLVEQSYDVIGVMMRLWSEPGNGRATAHNRCCTPDQVADARRVADQLQIPFYVVDVKEFFRQTVVDFFIAEHAAGRTPNPCIECNRTIRFTYLLQKGLALGGRYLATGHYARVRRSDGHFELLKAVDAAKDQSYVLHVLGQAELAQVMFPVGGYTKSEVRELARRFGLHVAAKSESMDLCFLADGDYRRFLHERAPHLGRPGPILTTAGEEVGRHQGLPNYTIGQRKGIGVALGEPQVVLRKDPAQNALIIGPRTAAAGRRLVARDVNWLSGRPPEESQPVQVKVRYRARGIDAVVEPGAAGRVLVTLAEPVAGLTPGQGAVFYDGEVCLGGGIIADEEAL